MNGAIMLLKAMTPLHPGAGTGIGPVDLPVQRETHTNWPMVQGSSLKGCLRDVARRAINSADAELADKDPQIAAVFGPTTKDAGEHAGALSVTDARTLAFPVRSLKGVYALVTCPAAIHRLLDDCSLAGLDAPAIAGEVPHAGCAEPDTLFFSRNGEGGPQVAVLEDLLIELGDNPGQNAASALATWLGTAGLNGLGKRLVIIDDSEFTFCVRYRTQVVTRNKLKYATKTVAGGALFNQELLPPEMIMYSVLLADKPFEKAQNITTGAHVIGKAKEWVGDSIMQFGGDATTGKGFCKCSVLCAAGGGS